MACLNEDMKVVKFKIMLEDMQKYLMSSNMYGFTICIVDKTAYQNIYLDSIYDVLCCYNIEPSKRVNWMAKSDSIDNLKNCITNLKNAYNYSFYTSCCTRNLMGYQLINNTVFWNLFILSLDEKIYENEIAKVVDLAYCLGFNEAMMRDWCRAVEYVLAGNRISEDCDLECETPEAKQYFKHEE